MSAAGARSVRVDRAVAVHQHLVAQAHEEHRGHHRDVRNGPHHLERGPDRVGGGVSRPGDHAVGSPARPSSSRSRTVHHQVRARSKSTPLCRRRSWYSAANRSRSPSSNGLSRRAPERSTPSIAARAWTAGVTQDGEVRDPAAQHDVRGLEDAVVVPLGQDDVTPVGHGEVEQVVLEHQRRDGVAARDLEPVEQGVPVDVLVEQRERGRDLARRVLVQAPASVVARSRSPSCRSRSR